MHSLSSFIHALILSFIHLTKSYSTPTNCPPMCPRGVAMNKIQISNKNGQIVKTKFSPWGSESGAGKSRMDPTEVWGGWQAYLTTSYRSLRKINPCHLFCMTYFESTDLFPAVTCKLFSVATAAFRSLDSKP